MKQFLVRGGADPLKQFIPRDLLIRDSFGGNSGNLMPFYGTINVLTTSKAKCISTFYKMKWTSSEIDEINQTFSAFVLPLADAFRSGFVMKLNSFTDFISQLKIPCIVNGVGLREKYDPSPDFSYPFNDEVKRFVCEVLNHSSMLGLRGEITGDYLKKLGFLPERDYTVIGCPAMYMHGELRENNASKGIGVALSLNGLVPARIEKFYTELMESNPKTYIVQQRTEELINLYYGRNIDLSTTPPEFSRNNIFTSFDYESMKATGRVKFFMDVPDWINNLKSFSLFVGARFHGTVAALLAGVPSIITPFDSRTRELASFHHIPTITEQNLEKEPAAGLLWSLADYGQVAKAHEKNLKHYIDFLKCNGLPSIFDEQADISFGQSPMEKQAFNNWVSTKSVSAYEACGMPERVARKAEYYFIKGSKRVHRLIAGKQKRFT